MNHVRRMSRVFEMHRPQLDHMRSTRSRISASLLAAEAEFRERRDQAEKLRGFFAALCGRTLREREHDS